MKRLAANTILIIHCAVPFIMGGCIAYSFWCVMTIGAIFFFCQMLGKGICFLSVVETRLRFPALSPKEIKAKFPTVGLSFLNQYGIINQHRQFMSLKTYNIIMGCFMVVSMMLGFTGVRLLT